MQTKDNNRDDNDEFLQRILQLYLAENEEENLGDFFTLHLLKKLHYKQVRCCSLKNEKVYNDWKNFLNNLPDSKNEIVSRPLEKYWRWKTYKKYVPEDRTNFRKTMRAGPSFDKYGLLPISGEDMRLYRQPHRVQKLTIAKKN